MKPDKVRVMPNLMGPFKGIFSSSIIIIEVSRNLLNLELKKKKKECIVGTIVFNNAFKLWPRHVAPLVYLGARRLLLD